MSVIQVGLVDTTGKINPALMQAAAAALTIQCQRDLTQFWQVQATVSVLTGGRVPSGVWPVQLVASLPPGMGGYHLDNHNQPYAKVIATPSDNSWTLDASHEIIEMLVDPYGNRMQSAPSITITDHPGYIKSGTKQFSYLVEACDPCEAKGYVINGILVSDFISPHYYDAIHTPGTRYSFTGAIAYPRAMLPGGYISFVDEETNEWKQILWVDPHKPPQWADLGPADGVRSLRAWIDWTMAAKDAERRATVKAATHVCAAVAEAKFEHLNAVAEARGERFGL